MTNAAPTWRYNKGDDVPSWLADCEPLTPGQRPAITFDGDVVVVETTGGFWILPERGSNDSAAIRVHSNGEGATRVFNADKPLHWPRRAIDLGGDGGGGGGGGVEPKPVLPLAPLAAG